jgi:transcriptional regulator with XRE-family HTH domain
MSITDRLRTIRIQRGYSQMDIANVLEMQQQQYSRYELGTNEIPVRHVITLCKFYGISSDWLLGLTDTF